MPVKKRKDEPKLSALQDRLQPYLARGPQLIPVTQRYPKDALEAGKALAKNMGITFNKLVVVLLKDAINQNKP